VFASADLISKPASSNRSTTISAASSGFGTGTKQVGQRVLRGELGHVCRLASIMPRRQLATPVIARLDHPARRKK
jgi:hypothetical protein